MMHPIRRILEILFIFSLIAIIGCANRRFEPITIDGEKYCVTNEKTFSEEWYSCYLRGISCARCREEECLIKARDELLRAIQRGKDDGRWVRTYGTHRLPEYFPNREIGIVHYYLYSLIEDPVHLDYAAHFLTVSLDQCPSAKAKYWLNKVRREKLILTGEDKYPPQLELAPYPHMTNTPGIILSGLVKDDIYVGNISIFLNNERPLSLLELSQAFSCDFQQKIILQPGMNTISIQAVDLIGREDEKRIYVLFDQEGPMIYFAESDTEAISELYVIEGMLYDPSEVTNFFINEKEVELSEVKIPEGTQKPISSSVYTFSYHPSLKEQKERVLHYRAIDSLENNTSGTVPFTIDEQKVSQKVAFHHKHKDKNKNIQEPFRIAMSPQIVAYDFVSPLLSYQDVDTNDHSEPVTISIPQLPQETFADEICPQITILAHHQIKDILVNDKSVLSLYGLSLGKMFFSFIRKRVYGENAGRFSFPRMINLEAGKNIITIKVFDDRGMVWEKSVQVIKKVRQIFAPNERWRITVHLENYNYDIKEETERKKSIMQKLMKAFLDQGRFWIVDFENLAKIIKERELSHYIDIPYLGIQNHQEIQNHPEIKVDAFLLVYVQEEQDSINLLGSLVDFETGIILATKEVFEEIQPYGISGTAWSEGTRDHIYHNCCILTAKFKNHFPLCDGNMLSFMGDEIKTSICQKDGLREKMKLIIYNDDNREGDYRIMGEAKVSEIEETYSLAALLEKLNNGDNRDVPLANWKVITR